MESWTSLLPWWSWIIISIAGSFSALKWLLTDKKNSLLWYKSFFVCSLFFMAILLILDNIIRGTGYLSKYSFIVSMFSTPSIIAVILTASLGAYKKSKLSETDPAETKALLLILCFCGLILLFCVVGFLIIHYKIYKLLF